MKYYFGIDGGGTKTHCYIGDEEGNVLGQGFGGSCNYQTCGIEVTKKSIIMALSKALVMASLKLEQLEYGVLGLSGADQACDFTILNELCNEIFGDVPYQVLNDTWIGLRTGAENGIVSICGTGAAHAGVSLDHKHEILRNIDFETGNRGGGSELVSKALHYAFRSNEGTYTKTLLEEEILKVFRVKTMDEVCAIIRDDKITQEVSYVIPKITLELASRGDKVAAEIVGEMGYTLGLYATALIQKLKLEKTKVAMVLIGGIFKTNHKILIDSYMKAVHQVAPLAYAIIPDKPPAFGALLLALEDKNH